MAIRPLHSDDLSVLSEWAEAGELNGLERLITLPAFWGFVLVKEDALAGFAYGWKLDRDVEVIQITIHPDFRRQGLGQMLLRHFVDEADAQICRLEVRADNTAALALYERYGFIKDGVRANYYDANYSDDYRGRVDAVMMTYHRPKDEEN